jgi:hypothetical protein
MSADHEFILYDLILSNPPGWRVRNEVLEPVDRVLTYQLEIYQGSPHGRESRRWRRVWVNTLLTANEISELEETYPKPERFNDPIDWARLTGKPT